LYVPLYPPFPISLTLCQKADSLPNIPGIKSIPDPKYHLRPEAIESLFLLYRITGDKALLNSAWTMFEAIEGRTRTQFGNAALIDVTKVPPEKNDRMESFWTAETLKYFYLMFSEPNIISLDEWVFNTEAHPFRRPGNLVP
jgi:mannosyl-oligosaccharide alpha-1,2-mannosidase